MSLKLKSLALIALLSIGSASLAGPCKRDEVRDGKGKCQSISTTLVPRTAAPIASAPRAAIAPPAAASAPEMPPPSAPYPIIITSRSASVVPGRSGYVEGLTVSTCRGFVQIPGVGWQTRSSPVEITTHSFTTTNRP